MPGRPSRPTRAPRRRQRCPARAVHRAPEAIQWFERALVGSPELRWARLNLGIAYQESGNTQQAGEQYRRVLESATGGSRERQVAIQLKQQRVVSGFSRLRKKGAAPKRCPFPRPRKAGPCNIPRRGAGTRSGPRLFGRWRVARERRRPGAALASAKPVVGSVTRRFVVVPLLRVQRVEQVEHLGDRLNPHASLERERLGHARVEERLGEQPSAVHRLALANVLDAHAVGVCVVARGHERPRRNVVDLAVEVRSRPSIRLTGSAER